ncbi:MAG: hypothetical protein WBP79_01815 [Candidatus Acidiferrales bacterium]
MPPFLFVGSIFRRHALIGAFGNRSANGGGREQRQRKMDSVTNARHNVKIGASFLCAAAITVMMAAPARTQSVGYSYLHIAVNGQTATNIVVNEKYNGWLGIEGVEAAPPAVAAKKSANAATKVRKDDESEWKEAAASLRAGKAGPGRLRFGAGDEGGFDPIVKAQKEKLLIPEADLDLYVFETNELVGKFKIRGIRVLSLEDVPASACPMYMVTLSFQSIAKE